MFTVVYDPIEGTKAYKKAMAQIAPMLYERYEGRIGKTKEYWIFKKMLLAKHGIEWQSPMDLNPFLRFEGVTTIEKENVNRSKRGLKAILRGKTH